MREVSLTSNQLYRIVITSLILIAILFISPLIGMATAHTIRVQQEYELQCIALGGHISGELGPLAGRCVK